MECDSCNSRGKFYAIGNPFQTAKANWVINMMQNYAYNKKHNNIYDQFYSKCALKMYTFTLMRRQNMIRIRTSALRACCVNVTQSKLKYSLFTQYSSQNYPLVFVRMQNNSKINASQLASCIIYADLNNSMQCMPSHVSADFCRCDILFL